MICSFVPYLLKFDDWYVTGGALNGAVICGLTLSFRPEYLLGASLIGAFHGVIYTQALKVSSKRDVNDYASDLKL